MASDAERRIRDKAISLMREKWPTARIIHELDLGSTRIDLAAITEDRIILGEIKSERDTLSRLPRQMEEAIAIGGQVLLFVADRWVSQIGHVPKADLLVETVDGFSRRIGSYSPDMDSLDCPHMDCYNSRSLMGLLHKSELLDMTKEIGGKARMNRHELMELAHENLTGREVRRGVLARLRSRERGWEGDPPIKVL